MPCSFTKLPLQGLMLVQPRSFPDGRGFFLESYKQSEFAQAGIPGPFVQDNHSCSAVGVVRGLHFQRAPHAQGKLVRVSRGRVWDVAVDLRSGSKTFGRWYGLELSAQNMSMLWIPAGFAHGFVSMEDGSELQYKCTAEYHGPSEGGILWNSPALGIAWPDCGVEPILSDKDRALPAFSSSCSYFPEAL